MTSLRDFYNGSLNIMDNDYFIFHNKDNPLLGSTLKKPEERIYEIKPEIKPKIIDNTQKIKELENLIKQNKTETKDNFIIQNKNLEILKLNMNENFINTNNNIIEKQNKTIEEFKKISDINTKNIFDLNKSIDEKFKKNSNDFDNIGNKLNILDTQQKNINLSFEKNIKNLSDEIEQNTKKLNNGKVQIISNTGSNQSNISDFQNDKNNNNSYIFFLGSLIFTYLYLKK